MPIELAVPPSDAMTPAERQRRHRARKRALASAASTTAAASLLPENMRLVRQVESMAQQLAAQKDKAQASAQKAEQLQQDLQAAQQRLQALRTCLGGVLPRLTPATGQLMHRTLKEAGFVAWLDSG
jgi:septal ring factor EnvC (AmiA/AmiB activator)